MMKAACLIAAIGGALCLQCGSSFADGVTPPVTACIRDNAPKVEKSVTSLTDGTEFLVNNICIDLIIKDQSQKQQARLEQANAAQRKRCDEKKAEGQSTKIGTGEDSYDPCAILAMQDANPSYTTIFEIASRTGVSDPDARALAAKTLLDLRLSHSTSGRAK